MHVHRVEITLPGCFWHADLAETCGIWLETAIVVEGVFVVVDDSVVVDCVVVEGALVVVVAAAARLLKGSEVHLTGYTAEQNATPIGY